MTRFQKGDRVSITFDGRTVPGEVILASSNGVSLALSFEAILGGYVDMMPVLWEEDHFRDLIKGERVEIARRAALDDIASRRHEM